MIRGRNIDRDTMSVSMDTPFDLSGAGATSYLYFNAKKGIRINSVSYYYTETSSSDAGKKVDIGIPGSTDEVYSYTSEVSKTAGYTATIDRAALDENIVNAGVPVVLTSEGGKTGDGEIIVSINYTVL